MHLGDFVVDFDDATQRCWQVGEQTENHHLALDLPQHESGPSC